MRPVPLALAVVAVSVVGFIWYRVASPRTSNKVVYTFAPAEIGDVKKTVSASGTLEAWTTVDVKSKAGGRINLLAVDVGSKVATGQIIAKIDPTDSLLTYNQAKASTQSAVAKQAQSTETYGLTVSQAAIAVQKARASLASSQASLRQAASRLQTAQTESAIQPSLTSAAILQAKSAAEVAAQNQAKLLATQAQDRSSAKATYDQAVANDRNAQLDLERQQALYDKGFVAGSTVDAARANAATTAASVASAKSRLDTISALQRAERDSAAANARQANAAYRSARDNAYVVQTKKNGLSESRNALLQAQAAVQVSQAQLADAIAAQANGSIRRLDITSAMAGRQSAEAQLVNAKATLDQTVVRATSDGVVLQKYVEQGTIITSGLSLSSAGTSIVQIGDVSRMYVDVAVDETDISSIRLGERVDISFDAYPKRAFSGMVAKINPQAVVESNVTTVHVRVEVDNRAEGFADLKPEMNATCEFIEAEAKGVVKVPSEAVMAESGQHYVQVAIGGPAADRPPGDGPPPNPPKNPATPRVERRNIKIGIVGNEATEIVTGLRAGDLVVVSTEEPEAPATDAAPKAAFGGGGMPGGPPPGMGGGGGRR